LNGRHVVFGEVEQDCLGIVSALEATGRDDGKVKYEPRPTITASGVL
jgi:peptidylprolyl isomerase